MKKPKLLRPPAALVRYFRATPIAISGQKIHYVTKYSFQLLTFGLINLFNYNLIYHILYY